MKTTRQADEIEKVRDSILESALDIIINAGFDALTMRRLASQTGMSAPNIYNYFSSKDEIYINLVIRGFEMLHDDLVAAYRRTDDGVGRIREMITAYLDFGMSRPRYYDIMFSRPTPKYNDYKGTPHETLSEVEYRISMNIAELAINAAAQVFGDQENHRSNTRRVIQIWSQLHGMISLHNSGIVEYVAEGIDRFYNEIVDELMERIV